MPLRRPYGPPRDPRFATRERRKQHRRSSTARSRDAAAEAGRRVGRRCCAGRGAGGPSSRCPRPSTSTSSRTAEFFTTFRSRAHRDAPSACPQRRARRRARPPQPRPPPVLGEHNDEALDETLPERRRHATLLGRGRPHPRGPGERDAHEPTASDVAAWGTAVSEMEPGVIELRGHPVQELIGTTLPGDDLADAPWRPADRGQARLLERRSSPPSTTDRTPRRSPSPGWRPPAASGSTARWPPGSTSWATSTAAPASSASSC